MNVCVWIIFLSYKLRCIYSYIFKRNGITNPNIINQTVITELISYKSAWTWTKTGVRCDDDKCWTHSSVTVRWCSTNLLIHAGMSQTWNYYCPSVRSWHCSFWMSCSGTGILWTVLMWSFRTPNTVALCPQRWHWYLMPLWTFSTCSFNDTEFL